ncbi:vesicle-associated protein 1-2-like isoform X2 [Diospyros lotus]|uniref:vesicle-associated protein 1-2-like isoform X2 n=1 Tax=Diospyros lotus TaxID=55363 RepID=UPI00225809CE|nr:vesicle-associated protein 1-2-like isoform X2 [Diospyros lotus]
MSVQLLDINPRELKFTFELKKQSSCVVRLVNISDQYVVFKVKTTSPKKYCVRPNVGIIKPKSKCDFTVTMQAQRSASFDKHCKDKFLIQSTVGTSGTTEEDINPGMFAKDSGKYVEESKLRVTLVSPPQSPVLLPVNGVMKQEASNETSVRKDKLLSGLAKEVEDVKSIPGAEELTRAKDLESCPSKNVEPIPVKDVEDTKLKLISHVEELKSKLNELESKLSEADTNIMKLTKERSTNIQEKEKLKQELAILRKSGRRVRVGFPFLFVCMVTVISLTVGYLLHR